MRVTERTKRALAYRRMVKALIADGFEKVSDDGAPLWELVRGGRWDQIITDVKIVSGGKELFVKIGKPQ